LVNKWSRRSGLNRWLRLTKAGSTTAPILNSLEESLARYGQRLRVERNRWSTVDTSRETVRDAEAGRQPRCDREQDAPRPASGHRVARLETLVASRWARMGTTRRDFGAAMCASAPVRTGWRPTPNPSSNRTLGWASVTASGCPKGLWSACGPWHEWPGSPGTRPAAGGAIGPYGSVTDGPPTVGVRLRVAGLPC
jgi:hypothetical protein